MKKAIICLVCAVAVACISLNFVWAKETPSAQELLEQAKNSLEASNFEQAVLAALEAKKRCTNDSERLMEITDIIRISHGHMAIASSGAFVNTVRAIGRMEQFNKLSPVNKSVINGILDARKRFKLVIATALYINSQIHMTARNQNKNSNNQGISAAEMKAGVHYNAAQALIRAEKGKEALEELSKAWASLDVAKRIFLEYSSKKKEPDKSLPRTISQI